jgi:hypothetical protein
MAKCPNPECQSGLVLGYPQRIAGSDDVFRLWYPCPKCGGAGELSCCEGPVGHADEMPTDPNERGEGAND